MKKYDKSIFINYHFEDFTEKNYARLIRIAKKKYKFEKYGTSSNTQHVLWRHDVDVSIHRALSLAKIEHNLSVTTTYFFRFHSEFYNLFEKSVYDLVKEILGLGHHLGLHFDMGFYNMRTKKQLIENLNFEKKILEELFLKKVNVFSFHNPDTGNALKYDDDKIAGMINTYGKNMKKQYSYCSDSNGYWRYRRLEDVLHDSSDYRLQVLTHPEWWQREIMSPKQRIHRCIDGRSEGIKKLYSAMLKDLGRKNIG